MSPSNCLFCAITISHPEKIIANAAVLIAVRERFFTYPLMFVWLRLGKMFSMMMNNANTAKRIIVFGSNERNICF